MRFGRLEFFEIFEIGKKLKSIESDQCKMWMTSSCQFFKLIWTTAMIVEHWMKQKTKHTRHGCRLEEIRKNVVGCRLFVCLCEFRLMFFFAFFAWSKMKRTKTKGHHCWISCMVVGFLGSSIQPTYLLTLLTLVYLQKHASFMIIMMMMMIMMSRLWSFK